MSDALGSTLPRTGLLCVWPQVCCQAALQGTPHSSEALWAQLTPSVSHSPVPVTMCLLSPDPALTLDYHIYSVIFLLNSLRGHLLDTKVASFQSLGNLHANAIRAAWALPHQNLHRGTKGWGRPTGSGNIPLKARPWETAGELRVQGRCAGAWFPLPTDCLSLHLHPRGSMGTLTLAGCGRGPVSKVGGYRGIPQSLGEGL